MLNWRSAIWLFLVASVLLVAWVIAVPAISAQSSSADGAHEADPAVSAPVQKDSGEPSRNASVPTRTPDHWVPPKLIHSVDPKLSKEARKAKVGGGVVVGLVIDEKGMPKDVHVIRGVGYGLDEKAVEAVSQYRFKPALKNGTPCAVELKVQVYFQVFTD